MPGGRGAAALAGRHRLGGDMAALHLSRPTWRAFILLDGWTVSLFSKDP